MAEVADYEADAEKIRAGDTEEIFYRALTGFDIKSAIETGEGGEAGDDVDENAAELEERRRSKREKQDKAYKVKNASVEEKKVNI